MQQEVITVSVYKETRELANWLRKRPEIRRMQRDLFHYALLALAEREGITVPEQMPEDGREK